jgi:flagellar hook-length control protein FliK
LIDLINLSKILGNSEKIQDVLSQINKNSQNGESFEKVLQRVIEELSKSEVESNPVNESSTQKSTNGLPKQDVKRSEEALKNADGLSERKVKEITAGYGIERGLDNLKGELKRAEIEKDNFKLLNKTQLMTKHEVDKPLDSLKPAEAIVEAGYDDSKKSTQDYGNTTLTVTENAEVIRGTQENNESLVLNKENKETASELKQKFIEEFSPKVPKENEKKITFVDASAKIQNNNGKENAIVHDGTEYLSNLQKTFSTENALVEPSMASNKQEQTTKPNSSLQPSQPDQSIRTSKSTVELTGKRQVSQLSEQSTNSKTYNEWRTSSQSQASRAFQDVKSYQALQSKQPQQVIENTAEAKGNNANNVPNISKDGNKTLNIHQNFGAENESMETKNVLKGLAFQSSNSGMVVNNPQNIPGANIQKDSLRSKDKFVDAGTEEREKREVGISNRVTTIVTTNKDNFRTDLTDKSQILNALTVEISRIIQKQQAVSASLSNVNHAGQKALSFHQIVQVQTEQKKNFTFQIQADIPLTVVEKGYSERTQKVSSQEVSSFPIVQTNSQKVLNDNSNKKSSNKSVDDNILQMINSIKVITSEHIRTIGDLENKNEKAPVVETVNSADPKLTNGQMIFAAELVKNIAAEKPKIHHNQTMENIENIDRENPLKVEDKTLLTNVFQSKIEKDVVEQVHSDLQSGSRDTESLAKEEYDAREFRNEIAKASKNKLEIKSFEIEYKMKEESKKEEFQERPNVSNKFLERLAELTYKSSEAKTEQTYQTNNRFELVERLQHSQNLEEIYRKIRDFGFSNRLEENVRMKLYPEQLGNIDVELRKEGKAITIVFVAENEKSKELLEKNIGILRDRLTALDFDVRNMEVKMKEESNYHEDARHHQNQQNQEHGEQNHENKRKAFNEEVMEDDNERERNG